MQDNRYRHQRVQFSFGGPMTPAVKLLLIVTTAAFFVQIVCQRLMGLDLEPLFGVVPFFVKDRLWLWQPVTYLFLHAGLFHLGLNMLVLWMFGCELERAWGRRMFFKYYFLCGAGAGLCIALISPAPPTPPYPPIPTIGASGALYGLLLAYGLIFPNRQILLWFILPIKAKHFVLIIGAIAFYATLSEPGSGVSHLGHLSGLLIGYIYLRGWDNYRKIRKWQLEKRLKNLRKKYTVINGNKDKDEPPYVN